jgi:hypothetical protein
MKIHENESPFVIGFAFFKCLYIYHIARNDIRDNHLPSDLCNRNAFAQHQGLLFDEETTLSVFFLAMAQK